MKNFQSYAFSLCVVFALSVQLNAQSIDSDQSVKLHQEVARASYTAASRELDAKSTGTRQRPVSQDRQIKVDVKFLLVDSAARADLYARLKHEDVRTAFADVPETRKIVGLPKSSSDRHSFDSVFVPSHVSTTSLDPKLHKELMEHIQANPHAQILSAPQVILIDGKEAEVKDLVQRPFMVNANYIAGSTGDGIQPVVKVCDQGTTIHVRASVLEGGAVQLAARIVSQEITEIRQESVYGIGPGATPVQIPVQRLRAVSAAELLQHNEILWIDPYVTLESEVTSESGVPVLSKLPVVGGSFKHSNSEPMRRHLIFTLQPKLHRSLDRSKS